MRSTTKRPMALYTFCLLVSLGFALSATASPSWKLSVRPEAALHGNRPVATAYCVREVLRRVWNMISKCVAGEFLDEGCRRSEASGIRFLKTLAHTLASHRSGTLAWHDSLISTGPLEGTNTGIRVLQRQAYGFRDTDFFKPKIMALHGSESTLVG